MTSSGSTTGVVGVLGLQGDFALHEKLLAAIDRRSRRVRRPSELADCNALIVPGGESTTLQILLRTSDLSAAIVEFAQSHPVMGTCAGAILMARQLDDAGGVEPWGLLDLTVLRNGFGRQVDSFEDELVLSGPGQDDAALSAPPAARGVFIRAPRILRVGEGIEILATHRQEPVAVRAGGHMALTFHPEVGGDPRWHRAWLGD